jgi:acetate kinase
MAILTVNVGSSSVRLVAYAADGARLATAHLTDLRQPATSLFRKFLDADPVQGITAAGHRIVHGGERFTASCRIDAAVEADIDALGELAPLHNPQALAWVRVCREVLGESVPQVAVFDTAFYADLPTVATQYALPQALVTRLGLRRYGFHGLAHRAMWQRWSALAAERRGSGRIISLQLGSGCSITAIRDGRPLDTSMGFSPLEGLVMATRSGDVDASALLHIQRTDGSPAEQLEALLNQRSGLLGMSGVSGDLRELLASTDPRARLAIDLYCYRAQKYLGAYLAVLGGVDAIVFGGGVGEHLAAIRQQILAGLEWSGIALAPALNATAIGNEARIDAGGGVGVWVIPVDESAILLAETLAVLR